LAKSWKLGGGQVFGYFDNYVPEEVIHAANILPVRMLGDIQYPSEADAFTKIYYCGHMRNLFSNGMQGAYDYLDGMVATDTCDTATLFFYLWRRELPKPYSYIFPLPHFISETADGFYYQQVIRFKESIEAHIGRSIEAAELSKAIAVYNENRQLLRQVYDLRRKIPPLISGVEALRAVVSSMLSRKEVHNELLRQFLEEASSSDGVRTGPRIMITGSPVYYAELIELIEGLGGNVVADSVQTGSRYFWDSVNPTSDPLAAIANRYMHQIPGSYIYNKREERMDHIFEMVKRYDVQGVVFHYLKYCSPDASDVPYVMKRCEDEGIPFTLIENDQTEGGINLLRGNLKAFVELLS